jgi:hypothetical protein
MHACIPSSLFDSSISIIHYYSGLHPHVFARLVSLYEISTSARNNSINRAMSVVTII